MKNVLITLLAACFLMACNADDQQSSNTSSGSKEELVTKAPVATAAAAFTQNYFGQLNNKNNVYVQLTVNGETVTGIYFYESQGIDIALQGTKKGDSVELFELNAAGTRTARISGMLSEKGFNGQWQGFQNSRTYPLSFHESGKNIKPLPVLSGVYRSSSETGCKLTVTISRSNSGYDYIFQSPARKLSGKVTISRGLNEGENYIHFQGIEWAAPAESAKTNPDTVADLDGMLADGGIQIQNTGNAMNSFTKLAECTDDKFITLVKEAN